MSHESSAPRAVADLTEGLILATVEVAAPLERVFEALASRDITAWWVRPGVFDTREWSGEVRVGGAWRASGIGGGRPYALEGEFTEVDRPRKLTHTWRAVGSPAASTHVSYLLEKVEGQTRITLRHAGFTSRETCLNTCRGWETSFDELAKVLAAGR
ncbi:MAG TPA: SRPBCC domain-containing protein [Spirochaetia bacterium]|nr:SRPBCC domain-containing protein [Spirochaetia bacterium]